MAISNRSNFENPNKSPWSFERCHSDLERRMVVRLEGDPHVVKWMKRHGMLAPYGIAPATICRSNVERLMTLSTSAVAVCCCSDSRITIPWIDGQKHQRRYVPDFLVEYEDGRKAIIEVKDPSRMDSNEVQRKRKAAEIWCRQRGMEYIVATVG
jgi:hypothetical protein